MLFGWFIWVPGCKREWLEITTVHLDINTQKTAKTARLAADRLCWAQFRTCNIVYRSKFSRLSTAGSVFPFNVSHAIIGLSLPIILDHLTSPALFAAWASMAFDDPNWCKRSRVIFMACVSRRPELPRGSLRDPETRNETLWTMQKEWRERRNEWKLTLWCKLCGREKELGREKERVNRWRRKKPLRGLCGCPCVCLCVYVFMWEEQRRKNRGGSCRQRLSYLYKSTDLVFFTLTLLSRRISDHQPHSALLICLNWFYRGQKWQNRISCYPGEKHANAAQTWDDATPVGAGPLE